MSKKFKITTTEPDENGFVSIGIGESVGYWFSSLGKMSESKDAHDICNQRANMLLETLKDDDIIRVTVSANEFRERDGRFVKADLLKHELSECTCSMADPLKCEACQ